MHKMSTLPSSNFSRRHLLSALAFLLLFAPLSAFSLERDDGWYGGDFSGDPGAKGEVMRRLPELLKKVDITMGQAGLQYASGGFGFIANEGYRCYVGLEAELIGKETSAISESLDLGCYLIDESTFLGLGIQCKPSYVSTSVTRTAGDRTAELNRYHKMGLLRECSSIHCYVPVLDDDSPEAQNAIEAGHWARYCTTHPHDPDCN